MILALAIYDLCCAAFIALSMQRSPLARGSWAERIAWAFFAGFVLSSAALFRIAFGIGGQL